ncbi:glycosyltransferase [Bacillus sp. 165]|nr:glycosyltransferase [Bacillus sp. 165]
MILTTLSATSLLFLLWTILNSMFLPKFTNVEHRKCCTPFTSILVPMRNEERNVSAFITNIQKLSYPNFECIILDDQSTDNTFSLLTQAIGSDNRFRIIKGNILPKGWVGKVHACHQLSQQAAGDYFLFLDADVQIQEDTVETALALLQKRGAKLLTGFPHFPVTPWLAKLLVPMQHFIVYFHLPIMLANYTSRIHTTAAHGAFMLFERNAYFSIEGHKSVKSSLVEDVHIARKMKANGHHVILANITSHVSCYMYETNKEVWSGFTKNIFIGLGRSVPLVIGLTAFYLIFYVWPFILIVLDFHYGMTGLLPILLLWLQRLYIDWCTKQQKWLFVTLPLSILSLIVIMIHSMKLALQKKNYHWKGRTYL